MGNSPSANGSDAKTASIAALNLTEDEKQDMKRGADLAATANSYAKKKKWSDAADAYQRASQNFKLAKQWGECGAALVQAGDCAIKANDRFNASDYYKRACGEFEKCPERAAEAMKVMRLSATILVEDGKSAMAGHTLRSLAQKEEKEGQLKEAQADWDKAADMFFAANDKSNSWTCRSEAGRLQLYENDWKSALQTFETLGQQQSEGDETAAKKMASAKSYWSASLCQLAMTNAEAAMSAINDYAIQAPAFGEGANGKLMIELAGHLSEGRIAEFDERLARYAEFSSLSTLEKRCFALARDNAEKNGPAGGGGDDMADLAGTPAPAAPTKPKTVEDELA